MFASKWSFGFYLEVITLKFVFWISQLLCIHLSVWKRYKAFVLLNKHYFYFLFKKVFEQIFWHGDNNFTAGFSLCFLISFRGRHGWKLHRSVYDYFASPKKTAGQFRKSGVGSDNGVRTQKCPTVRDRWIVQSPIGNGECYVSRLYSESLPQIEGGRNFRTGPNEMDFLSKQQRQCT